MVWSNRHHMCPHLFTMLSACDSGTYGIIVDWFMYYNPQMVEAKFVSSPSQTIVANTSFQTKWGILVSPSWCNTNFEVLVDL
jgi:hypothetical protein